MTIRLMFFAIVLIWSASCAGQTTRPTFQERVESAMGYASPPVSERWTNDRKVRGDWIAALKSATPEKLRTPQLLSSRYAPKDPEDGHVPVHIFWLEDQPTLREVTLVNPATKKEFVIQIPDDVLKTRRQWAANTVLHIYFATDVPAEVTGTDPDQQLELRMPDGQTAAVYPSVLDESKPLRTFEQRVERSIREARETSGKWTNDGKVRDEWIAALKAATPEKLRTPQLLPSLYYPKEIEDGHRRLDIWWLEDKPTLREVTLVNPATKKEFVIRFDDDDMELIQSRAPFIVLHGHSTIDVPVEVTGEDADHQLELRAGDGQRVAVYPSVRTGAGLNNGGE